jgi:hypothetical protein
MARTSTSGQGRPKGTPNKATTEARQAISKFVDGNAHRLQEWLDQIANGVPAVGPDGRPVLDAEGKPRYLVTPNPEKAFDMFSKVAEYAIPKLARTEVTGANGGPVQSELTVNVAFTDGKR